MPSFHLPDDSSDNDLPVINLTGEYCSSKYRDKSTCMHGKRLCVMVTPFCGVN